MMLLQTFVTLAFLCAASNAFPGRIVDGTATDITEVPYTVSLQRVASGKHFCGGSILSKKWILTAAHCVVKVASPKDIRVSVGLTLQSEGGVVHAVKTIISDPRYGSVHENSFDIAVLELVDEIKFNDKAKPVLLPKDDQPLPVGKVCTVQGWGRVSEDGPLSDELLSIDLPILKPDYCAQRYKYPLEYFSGEKAPMICAGWNGSKPDTCNGDSGGALVCDDIQYGIVSFGKGCAHPLYPKVFTHVYNLRKFIHDNTDV